MVQIDCCASFAQPCYAFKTRAVETTIRMKAQAKLAAIQTFNSIHGIRRHKMDLVDGNTVNVYSHNIPYLNDHVDFFLQLSHSLCSKHDLCLLLDYQAPISGQSVS